MLNYFTRTHFPARLAWFFATPRSAISMSEQSLPPELVSLVHHVELNQAGWWEKAVQQLIVGAIWLSRDGLSATGVTKELGKYSSAEINPAIVQNHLEVMAQGGPLVCLTDGRYKIAESALGEYTKKLEEALQAEDSAKARFLAILADCAPSMDGQDAWQSFNEDCLMPLVRQMGARTYEFVFGSTDKTASATSIDDYLSAQEQETKDKLRSAILQFLDPRDAVVRSHILRHLNAYFFIEAGGLQPETLEKLGRVVKERPRLDIFIDTNFLFSVLRLHENPSTEAAEALMEMASRLGQLVRLNLYVAPVTVDETKGTLAAISSDLGAASLPPNLARAGIRAGLGGIALKYATEVAKSRASLNPGEYFRPYIADLVTTLKSKGIKLYNKNLDPYGTRQDVVDDINAELEFEKTRKLRRKGYAQLRHDMVLWHFVQDSRPAVIEAPLEAQYWIVTIDYRLLGFDAFKRRGKSSSVPLCVHPTTLVQVLQFWIPRTAAFEEAVVGSLRLPFLMSEFDRDSEQITLKILEVLNRFEKVGDLSDDAVAGILMNQVFRQRFAGEGDVERQTELVREALIAQDKATRGQLESTKVKLADTEHELSQTTQRLTEAQATAEAAETRAADSDSRLKELQGARELADRMRQIRVDFTVGVVAPFLFAVLAAVGLVVLFVLFAGRGATLAIAIVAILLLPWLYGIDREGENQPAIRNWAPFRLLHRFRVWVFGAFGAVLATLVSGGLIAYFGG